MTKYLNLLGACLVCSTLAGCFQTELGGPVAGAEITITDLRTGELVEMRSSGTLEEFFAAKSRLKWDQLDDLGKMINLGNFEADDPLYTRNRWYLVTATGGADMDRDSDGTVDAPFVDVSGSWHALMTGRQLQDGGYMISALTEALYQRVLADIDSLNDQQLQSLLNQQTRLLLPDINEDGSVNYLDTLAWTVLLSRDAYLRDFGAVTALSEGIRQGEAPATIRTLAEEIFTDPAPDALAFFSSKISGPIVQARCVTCHDAGGIAPSSGARLILAGNNTNNFMAINDQAFRGLGDRLSSSQDLSDYVTGKASNQIRHGGGTRLAPGSQEFRDMTTYLNLIE
ncbi:hypothetical protein EY643_00575 [Halioglobus maricola]|uniref:Cytochrome c domain-containing protein n=1 Tax=Halioglobus maricola TaxID=2601894 RepID=A0A5P9NEV1_9GAMM|nr:hypothetical protein [Halioglobus maricola]QFU74260.1 hypothetical protein EY643_00575 [Halioglobus maricola]